MMDPNKRLTDNDLMPFGKYMGERMEDVPADYLHWLWTQCNFRKESPVGWYIQDNLNSLKLDHPDGIWE